MDVLTGDFIGFSYNGVHSSELGIIRTSEGSRFNENLLPTSKDVIVQVPGGDGTYYFGSYYSQRNFTVSYAFDGLSEIQIESLSRVFGDKKIHPLIFDEKPYKTYYAKVTGTTSIKHIPFTSDGERIYKGEGTIQFTCYQPFAICNKKFLQLYNDDNINEWRAASGLLWSSTGIDTMDNGLIQVYNPGVKDTDWRMGFHASSEGERLKFFAANLKLDDKILSFEGCYAKGNDNLIVFNSKTKMVEGYIVENGNKQKSGNLYNEYLISGDFFDIPVTRNIFDSEYHYGSLVVEGQLKDNFDFIEYDYYYY